MADSDVERRLRAVERALTDDDPVPDLAEDAELCARVDGVRADADELAARVDDLEAAVQAVRGYVGQLEHVNERVERRANAACAAVDRLEAADRPGSRGHAVGSSSPREQRPAAAGDPGDASEPEAPELAARGDQSRPEPAARSPSSAAPAAQSPSNTVPAARSPSSATLDRQPPSSSAPAARSPSDSSGVADVLDRLRDLL